MSDASLTTTSAPAEDATSTGEPTAGSPIAPPVPMGPPAGPALAPPSVSAGSLPLPQTLDGVAPGGATPFVPKLGKPGERVPPPPDTEYDPTTFVPPDPTIGQLSLGSPGERVPAPPDELALVDPALRAPTTPPAEGMAAPDPAAGDGGDDEAPAPAEHPMAHLMPKRNEQTEASKRAAEQRAEKKRKARRTRIALIAGFILVAAIAGPPLGKWLVSAINEAGSTTTEEPAEPRP